MPASGTRTFATSAQTATPAGRFAVLRAEREPDRRAAEPDRLRGGFVTSGFFDVVGVPPTIGVAFDPDADTPNGERVAVLTDSTWRHRFGGRHDIVGRQIQLNNAPFTIVGVLPASFRFPIDDVEVCCPSGPRPRGSARTNHNYIGIARLSPGSTPTQAGPRPLPSPPRSSAFIPTSIAGGARS